MFTVIAFDMVFSFGMSWNSWKSGLSPHGSFECNPPPMQFPMGIGILIFLPLFTSSFMNCQSSLLLSLAAAFRNAPCSAYVVFPPNSPLVFWNLVIRMSS